MKGYLNTFNCSCKIFNMERKTRFPYLSIDLSLHVIGLCGNTNIKTNMQAFLY